MGRTLKEVLDHQFTFDSKRSQYGVLLNIFNAQGNLVKFDYSGKAQAPMEAYLRLQSGETLSPEAKGHIHHKKNEPMAFVTLGNTKDNLNITLLRSMETRREDGSYDTRTYTVASPIEGPRITTLEVCRPFRSWETLSLRDLPVWPQVVSDEDRSMLVSALVLRAELEGQKEFCDKIKDCLRDKFNRDRKKNPDLKCLGPDGIVYFKPPQGETNVILNETGERVKQVPFVVKNGLKMLPANVSVANPYVKPEPLDIAKLPYFTMESKRLQSDIKALNLHIRPFELGLAEVSLNKAGQSIAVSGVQLMVHQFDVKEYDLPEETKEKVKDGTWKVGKVEKGRGQNIFVPLGMTEKEAEDEAEKEDEALV